MKRILILITLMAVVNMSFAAPHDSLSYRYEYVWPTTIKLTPTQEAIDNGTTMIVAGLLLTGIGIVKEVAREPYPTHPTDADYRPDAPMILNYMLIGSGVALTGLGVHYIYKF